MFIIICSLRILFWHIDGDKYKAPTLVREAHAVIKRAIDRGMPDSDIEALKAAFHHLLVAFEFIIIVTFLYSVQETCSR